MPRAPHGTPPIARTRQGYDHAPGYAPGYAPDYGPNPALAVSRSEPAPRFEPHELEGNVRLQPSHRLLYLGIGVVLVGIIVLLAISIADNRDEPAAAPGSSSSRSAVGSRSAESEPPPTPPIRSEATAPAANSAEPTTVRRATIHLHVVSTPPGAEVSLSGTPLGVTPLDVDIERRTGSEPLTIHRTRYQDVTLTVDLGRDYEQTVSLTPLPEPVTQRPPGGGTSSGGSSGADRDGRSAGRGPDRDARSPRPTERDGAGTRRTQSLPPREDCQPPDKINPYEKACHGHVCKPCPTP
jgi:hypothetical protein